MTEVQRGCTSLFWRYTGCVTSKKGVIGIGVSNARRHKSRNRNACGFFFCGPSFGGPDGEPQGSPVSGLRRAPVRQPVRAAALIGVRSAVVINARLEATMARSQPRPASAGASSLSPAPHPDWTPIPRIRLTVLNPKLLPDIRGNVQELSDQLHEDVWDAQRALACLEEMLQAMPHGTQLSAAGLLALVRPISAAMETCRGDAATLDHLINPQNWKDL